MNDCTSPQPPTIDIEKRVGQYVKLRDRIKELDTQHEDMLAPFKKALEDLNGVLINYLNNINAESVKTKAGTISKSKKANATIADKSAFWTYVVTQGDFEMLDYKANVKSVSDYIAKQAERARTDPTVEVGPPPGVNYSERFVAGIRRS